MLDCREQGGQAGVRLQLQRPLTRNIRPLCRVCTIFTAVSCAAYRKWILYEVEHHVAQQVALLPHRQGDVWRGRRGLLGGVLWGIAGLARALDAQE